jgi:hypothetical protein
VRRMASCLTLCFENRLISPFSLYTGISTGGGGSVDPSLNIALAVTLRKAKASGVPKDNIEKALARVRDGHVLPSFNLLLNLDHLFTRLQIKRGRIHIIH